MRTSQFEAIELKRNKRSWGLVWYTKFQEVFILFRLRIILQTLHFEPFESEFLLLMLLQVICQFIVLHIVCCCLLISICLRKKTSLLIVAKFWSTVVRGQQLGALKLPLCAGFKKEPDYKGLLYVVLNYFSQDLKL